MSGDPYAESAESRIRDRYAVGTALGVACYVPEDEGHLSFIEGDTQDVGHALPYEWYRLRKTRVCGEGQSQAQSTLVIWIPDDALSGGILGHPDLVVASPGVRRIETKERMPPDRRPAQAGPSGSIIATGRHVQARGAPQFLRPASSAG